MATSSRAQIVIALTMSLSFFACRPPVEPEIVQKRSIASPQSSGEELVILGLFVTKKLVECRNNPANPCGLSQKTSLAALE